MIKITFPDGSTKEYEEGVSPADIAKDISQRLYKNSIAAEVNGTFPQMMLDMFHCPKSTVKRPLSG